MNDIDVRKIEEFIKVLDEKELIYINRLIIERLKLLSQQRSTTQMTRFNIGERVAFVDNNGKEQKGIILKLNKKTVTLKTDSGERWNVAPVFLKPV